MANLIPVGCKCFITLDCCHIGSGLDLKYTIKSAKTNNINFIEDQKCTKTNGTVVVLSGCADNQKSVDIASNYGISSGVLTNALINTWSLYSSTTIPLDKLLYNINNYMIKNNFLQKPQISFGNNKINFCDNFDLN